MTTLAKHFEEVKKLMEEGHGNKKVLYRNGSSGDCGQIGSIHVSSLVDAETGPFDLDDDEEYVSLYIGH